MQYRHLLSLGLTAVFGGGPPTNAALDTSTQIEPEPGNVIFIHPDGAGEPLFTALRNLSVGPDGMLAWDRMEEMGVYRGHQKGTLTTSSHAGATAHAYGKKVPRDSFGMHGKEPLSSLSGQPHSVLIEAHRAGIAVGLINSGHIAEPGTAVFAASSPERGDTDRITAELLEADIPLILSGGETLLLPAGTTGRFGAGMRQDGRNLIAEAEAAGYTVVFTAAELEARGCPIRC